MQGRNKGKATYKRWRRALIAIVALSLYAPAASAQTDVDLDNAPVRIFFSPEIFKGLNETDINASLYVWANHPFQKRDIPLEATPQKLDLTKSLADNLEPLHNSIVTLTSEEIVSLPPGLISNEVMLTYRAGSLTDEYLTLCRTDSPSQTLADLRGKSLLI